MKNDGKFRYLLVVERWTENITMDQLPTRLLNTLLQVLISHVVLNIEKYL